MNILVLNGSPKGENGNTMALTRAFLEGAGWKDAEVIDAAAAGVKGCTGCYTCWTKTPGTCVLRDGMDGILPKMIAADVLIWSFPLYYFSVPGILKNIIDRQLPTSLPFMAKDKESGGHPKRYDLTRRRHAVISTCGFWTARGNYDAVTAMFDHMYGAEKYAKIFCGQGEVFRIPETKQYAEVYLETVRRAGAEFAAGGIAADTLDELAEPVFERDVFEKMADASWNVDASGNAAGTDDSLSFTKQMAALYRPDGEERVVEFHYADIGKTYQILLTKQGSEVIAEGFRPHTTRIETPYTVWRSISRGEISGPEAMFQRLFTVTGDFTLMLKWNELFGAPAPKDSIKKN